MLYKERLKENLKNEKDPILQMYLNELLLYWQNVDAVYDNIDEYSEEFIPNFIKEISLYTEQLSINKKFTYSERSKTGFTPDHDIFKPYYIFDILLQILKKYNITDSTRGLSLRKRYFHTGLSLNNDSFISAIKKPYLKYSFSDNYYSLCLELDLQYRLAMSKSFTKIKIYVPLIVFYIRNYFTNYDVENIKKLKNDIQALNPNALILCLSEYIEKTYIDCLSPIKNDIYVLRKAYKGTYKHIDLNLFAQIESKIHKFITERSASIEDIVPYGNIDFINNNYSEEKWKTT